MRETAVLFLALGLGLFLGSGAGLGGGLLVLLRFFGLRGGLVRRLFELLRGFGFGFLFRGRFVRGAGARARRFGGGLLEFVELFHAHVGDLRLGEDGVHGLVLADLAVDGAELVAVDEVLAELLGALAAGL